MLNLDIMFLMLKKTLIVMDYSNCISGVFLFLGAELLYFDSVYLYVIVLNDFICISFLLYTQLMISMFVGFLI